MHHISKGLSLIAVLFLPSCAPEAGASLSEGFGSATEQNTKLMSGEHGFAVSLNQRFAAEVPTTVTFAFNSALLDAEARATLDRQASWIRQFPEVRFAVYGHTDLVGTESYNYRLGRRRAEAVVGYLSARGIGRDRLEALVSFGKTQPVIATPREERRNRRAMTSVSGLVKGHPALLNGKYAEIIHREYLASAVPKSAAGDVQPLQ